MSAQFQFLEHETQFKGVISNEIISFGYGTVTIYNSQNQALVTVTVEHQCCDGKGPQYVATHHALGEVIRTSIIKSEKCCFCCMKEADYGVFAGQEHLGSLRQADFVGSVFDSVFRYPSMSQGYVHTPTEMLDPSGNVFLNYHQSTSTGTGFMAQMAHSDQTTQTMISQGGNHVATLDTHYQLGVFQGEMSATMSVSPQLPVPVKLCLMINLAIVLFDMRQADRNRHSG
ncbi:Oidioi.mRNA.OKI2018_I69.chr1.g3739.t1.cds [Oikopleura dioica]|uniref:Oidioi.mRNA.OKI2018_I69.chr1.g3739.t1.cds n=1 Tax=Oikopleura dioica TaxID=34765 RepID=A0ABN7T0M2_OIKDI|nr:Oidioi.mRNA.OKI2018_I69.chr1.g3739.t1.cds [Oikopleura dioica]